MTSMMPLPGADSSLIAFHSDQNGDYEVYRMSAGGSLQTNLTNDISVDRAPDWER